MKMKPSLVLEISLLALFVAAPGCTKPATTTSSSGTGGSGAASGGSKGTGGSNGTGTGGSNGTGTGGSNSTTGTGGSTTIGTGGSNTTTGSGGTTTTTGTGGSNTTTGTGGSNTTTGTGGSTTTGATGGTTGGGTGGAAGAPVVKDCATKTVVMNPVFMNFENYTGTGTVTAATYTTAFGGTTPNTGNAYTGFFPYPESDGGTEPALAMVAGHPPSNWAVSETLSATMWGMGSGIWMGCANASAYKGISLWVRGTAPAGTFSFSISMDSTRLPDAANAAGGGTCPGTKATCVDPVKSNLPITTDWTQVQILWSDFAPGMSGTGTSVVPNGDNIAGMGWSVPLQYHLDPSVAADAAGPYIAIPADVRIDIDDITFIM